nr:reverse transcriptase domain-containing protein [Tanacetum cinerariifolium]
RFYESFSEAWDRFKDLLRACPHYGFSELNQLDTFYNALNSKDQDSLNSAAGGNFLDKMPRECLAIIKSKSKVHYSCNKPVVAKVSTNTTSGISPDVVELKDMVKALLLDKKSHPSSCYRETSRGKFSGTLPSNTIANPRSDLKSITTRIGVSYDGPQIPPLPSFLPKSKSPILTSEPANSSTIEPVISPVSAPKPNLRPSIPYPSRMQDQKLREKANDQREKFFQIFKDLNFNISFVDALILMPKFGPSVKSLLTNKDKLCELARTPLDEHCSAVLLKKLPKKLGDLGKFLIPCDFPGKAECLALADLGASINLMPLSVWNKLSLLDLTPMCMTLELADRSISHPVGVAEDVNVKVGSFHFLANFIVVDFDADPRVPLILGRSFLKTERALIDVFKGELTLRVGKEAITFNLDQTSRYSANYNKMTAKRIDVIDMACEEYSQEVLGFSDVISSGNPTPYYDLIVSITSLTLTPFENNDFLLEEVDAFLAIEDDPTSPEVDQSYLDPEGDILLLEAFLNDDTSLPPPNQGNYLPEVRKELKICEAKSVKSSIDEPPEVELKDLPPHLEYAFLEGNDKLPVIIAKNLSVEEKIALITDFEPVVQHQRRVNSKIYGVIKQEVMKLLDAGLIYPISNSPWVSLVHYVPKKGGFTVVENKDNELIPNRLVTGWRVCINYRKLNEATRKDHFPLPFMDQMLERLAGNQYYCFLDGFSGYFQIPIDLKNREKTTYTFPYGTFAYRRMPFGLCNAPGTFQRPMTYLLEKDTPFIFSKECVEAFQTLKRKLTEAPILIAPDWDMPFELMCDASDFAISAVLGQRQDKHFRPIHYASKTMTEAESNYTIMKKEMLAVVFKGEIAPLGSTPPGIHFKVIDTKEAENLATDHLSRLENPHQNVLDPKEINESFSLKTLNLVSNRGNSSTPWFADFANYHAGNFVVKGMSSQKKTYKTPIGCTPYKLVYGKACHLPIELEHKAYWALKHANFDMKIAGDHRKVQLNELRDQAYENSLIYKEKTKRLHDSKIKDRVFNIDDRVLLFNSQLKIFFGKFKSRWSGPYTISHVYPYGTVELAQPDVPNFKVNGRHLKHYFGEDVPKLVVPDLQTFLKDH